MTEPVLSHESSLLLTLEEISQLVAHSHDPGETLTALQRGVPGYERYFVRKWLRSLRRKQAAWPDSYDFSELARLRDLRRMTRELVLSHTEFPTLEDYLKAVDPSNVTWVPSVANRSILGVAAPRRIPPRRLPTSGRSPA